MKTSDKMTLQYIMYTFLAVWVIYYQATHSWSLILLAATVIAVTGIHAYFADPKAVGIVKMKFNDRGLFVDDFIKAVRKFDFLPTTTMDNHFFFSRSGVFQTETEIIDLKFLEDGECLITCPIKMVENLRITLTTYVTMREREFIKETDKLMEEKG